MLTKFEMWSAWHYVYIAAPIVIILLLYFGLRKTSYKLRYIVGVIIGCISLSILLMRNIDMYLDHGFDAEEIPLQVCHFGNIMVFIALVFKSKTAGSIAFCLNVIAAFASHIDATSLSHYSNIMSIRAQAYIWGHMLIVVGGLYGVLLKIYRLDWKSFGYGVIVLICLLIPAIILNSYFNDLLVNESGKPIFEVNYFYIYSDNGIDPLSFAYGLVERSHYGEWFTIDWVYTAIVVGLGASVMALIFCTQYLLYIHDKDYHTDNIFYEAYKKSKAKKLANQANI